MPKTTAMDTTVAIVAADIDDLVVPLCKLVVDGLQESSIDLPPQHCVAKLCKLKIAFCSSVKSEHEDTLSQLFLPVPKPKLPNFKLPFPSPAELINRSQDPLLHPIAESENVPLPVYFDLSRQTPDRF